MALNETIKIESIVNTTLRVSPKQRLQYGQYEQAIIPVVSGNAFFTGYQQFWIDPADPLKEGFFIR